MPKLKNISRYQSSDEVRPCNINCYLTKKYFDDDGILLSEELYKLFISKGLGPLLDYYYSSNLKPPKIHELHEMSKTLWTPCIEWL